jgi:tRNA threonylcarbamoyladenosine biosynthesis protein TsaB
VTRILALDTSTWWGSVALVERTRDGPRVVAEREERIDGSHAEHLLSWIEALLQGAGWSRGSVDAYVATRGPGSFTGVRVALGTIRGLGLATGRPCVGVTTLAAIAQAHGRADRPRAAVMDAGRGELFAARFDAASAPPAEVVAPWLGPADEVLRGEDAAGALFVPGPGTEVPREGGRAVAAAPRGLASAAGSIVALAGVAAAPPPLAPLYLRAPDALLKRRRS